MPSLCKSWEAPALGQLLQRERCTCVKRTLPLCHRCHALLQTVSRKQASAEELAMDYVGPAEEFVKLLRYNCPPWAHWGRATSL